MVGDAGGGAPDDVAGRDEAADADAADSPAELGRDDDEPAPPLLPKKGMADVAVNTGRSARFIGDGVAAMDTDCMGIGVLTSLGGSQWRGAAEDERTRRGGCCCC